MSSWSLIKMPVSCMLLTDSTRGSKRSYNRKSRRSNNASRAQCRTNIVQSPRGCAQWTSNYSTFVSWKFFSYSLVQLLNTSYSSWIQLHLVSAQIDIVRWSEKQKKKEREVNYTVLFPSHKNQFHELIVPNKSQIFIISSQFLSFSVQVAGHSWRRILEYSCS